MKETTEKKSDGISRRKFLGSAAAMAAAFTIVPRHVLGGEGQTPPSERINVACIGAGGNMCRHDMKYLKGQCGDAVNYVALCEVINDTKDWLGGAAEAFQEYCPNAKRYTDYRVMLEKQKDIDAVLIATPDHSHAAISMAAIKMGKHVYCEKPLTHTIHEARAIAKAAREAKVATQMGNNGHAGEWIRLFCEFIWDGAIGPVREIHAWTDRPQAGWPQTCGRTRPTETPPVPASLDWDLWLGPAPQRPYHPDYLSIIWRGWQDFGTGALGDMGCHIVDPAFWALDLGSPISVEASSTLVTSETYPLASTVHYKFGPRKDMPPLDFTWYDGGIWPPRPEELEPGRQFAEGMGGLIAIGDKGKLLCPTFSAPRLIPESRMKEYKRPEKTIPRSPGHYTEWIAACKGSNTPPRSNFDYASSLTEMILLGNIAIKTKKKLLWDGPNMKFTNAPEANELIHRPYRQGWTL